MAGSIRSMFEPWAMYWSERKVDFLLLLLLLYFVAATRHSEGGPEVKAIPQKVVRERSIRLLGASVNGTFHHKV